MIDFDFISPTKIYFGKKKEEKIAEICHEFGFNSLLIVVGQGSVIKSGLLTKVTDLLDKKDIKHCLLSGVRPNPTIDLCYKGIELAKANKVDLILAIGGGSVIDTAKNISVGYYYSGDSFDFNTHKTKPTKALPIGVILTISAAGSELSSSCVIQDDKSGVKMGFNSDLVRPLFAIENPELTYTVPKQQIAYGIVDIMMHTLERYFQPSNNIEPADGFAETVLKSTVDAGKKAYLDSHDYESQAVLMLMSSLSHNDLTNIGKKKMMPVHQLEHVLSGLYPYVAHAAGLAVLFPRWAKYYLQYDIDKFAKLAKNVFNCTFKDNYEGAKMFLEEINSLYEFLNMPKNFKDLGIKDVDIECLVNRLTNNGTRVVDHHSKPLDKDVARIIYNDCI